MFRFYKFLKSFLSLVALVGKATGGLHYLLPRDLLQRRQELASDITMRRFYHQD